jgi:ABC-2 type transport system ATP-binding protein
LDEPTNGLDPAGVHWLRAFLRARADSGATVVVSSHLLAELALSADHVVIIKDGALVAQGSVADLTRGQAPGVRVRTPQVLELQTALRAAGIVAELVAPDELLARQATPEQVGQAVATAGLVIYEMSVVHRDLEDAFLDLTAPAGGVS